MAVHLNSQFQRGAPAKVEATHCGSVRNAKVSVKRGGCERKPHKAGAISVKSQKKFLLPQRRNDSGVRTLTVAIEDMHPQCLIKNVHTRFASARRNSELRARVLQRSRPCVDKELRQITRDSRNSHGKVPSSRALSRIHPRRLSAGRAAAEISTDESQRFLTLFIDRLQKSSGTSSGSFLEKSAAGRQRLLPLPLLWHCNEAAAPFGLLRPCLSAQLCPRSHQALRRNRWHGLGCGVPRGRRRGCGDLAFRGSGTAARRAQ